MNLSFLFSDYRCLFLLSVFAVFLLYRIRTKTSFFGFINRQAILSLMMALAVVGAIASFIVMMTDISPIPYIRTLGYYVGMKQLVDYADAIPPHFADNYAVQDVIRKDVDGDGFSEWLVIYTYNEGTGETPITGIVYDNDRGNPPVIYPYALVPPNGEPLSEGDYTISYVNVTDNKGINGKDLSDIVIFGYDSVPYGIPVSVQTKRLTFFKHQQQSGTEWDMPTDNPRRYVSFGHFGTDGFINFDERSKDVMVFDRGEYERSQLGIYKAYSYDKTDGYLSKEVPNQLKRPDIETINFFPAPPSNIYVVSYPEQIALAFYASMCRIEGRDLCQHADLEWAKNPDKFLLETAAERYKSKDAAYFGLSTINISNLSVSNITYQSEQPNISSLVTLTFTADQQANQSVTLRLHKIDGEWKITEVVQLQASTLGTN